MVLFFRLGSSPGARTQPAIAIPMGEGIISKGPRGNDKLGRLVTVPDVSVPVRRRDGPGNIVKVGCQAGRGEALQNGFAVCPCDYP